MALTSRVESFLVQQEFFPPAGSARAFVDAGPLQIPDLVMTIEYDDKEGDLGGGTITYVRDRLNIIPIQDAASNDKADTIRSQLPEFPKTSTGEMEIRVPGLFLQEDPDRNDTMEFKIYVQDVAGNVSDTITTPIVVQSKP